jgi:RimJ/RimL family protein N-acetyltransferase
MSGQSSASPVGDVRLRDVTADDLPIFFEHQLDPEATRMAAFPSRERAQFMKHWARILDNDDGMKQTVLYDDQVAGNVVSWTTSGGREIGYWLGREFWGKGIGTRAVAAFLEVETTRPLYAHVAGHNAGSIRVLQKNGFQIVGPGDVVDDEGGKPIKLLLLKLAAGEPDPDHKRDIP